MNNLAYTIRDNEFFYKTLISQQRVNQFRWQNGETRGFVNSGKLRPGFCYSYIEFVGKESLALNYHPKDARGFVIILNYLDVPGYVQLMTPTHLIVDYSPRPFEVYVIPADRVSAFTYAPGTKAKRLEFFVSHDIIKSLYSRELIFFLQERPFFLATGLLNDTQYKDLTARCHFPPGADPDASSRPVLTAILRMLGYFTGFGGNPSTGSSSAGYQNEFMREHLPDNDPRYKNTG